MLNANVTIETKDNFKKIYCRSIDWKAIIQKVNNLRRRIYMVNCLSSMLSNSLVRFFGRKSVFAPAL